MYRRQPSCRGEQSLGPRLTQSFLVPFKIFHIVCVIVDAPFFEETVELNAFKSQHLARLIMR